MKFNIEVKTTARYRPWKIVLLERHNQTLTETIMKVKASNGCDWSTVMDWALMVKNTMQNVHVLTPFFFTSLINPQL